MFEVRRYKSSDQPAITRIMGARPYKTKIWDWQYRVSAKSTFNPVVIYNEKNDLVIDSLTFNKTASVVNDLDGLQIANMAPRDLKNVKNCEKII